jgi:Spx/MgsR family transcriptional regulator
VIKLYGIKNCDTVKKARRWLDEQGISYTFHDYQVQGLGREQLLAWIKELSWQKLLNTRGTTWRQLTAEMKLELDEPKALELMLQKTSLIKRPLLDLGNQRLVGFSELEYQQWFK